MNYARYCDCKEGTKLRADGGFTCIKEGAILEVKKDHTKDEGFNLYVECNDGQDRHYIDGQVDDPKTDIMIGFEIVS